MSIHNNPAYYRPNGYDFEEKVCYLAKCAVALAVIQALAKHIFGIENIALVGLTCFVASELVKGVGAHLRIDGVVAHHRLMGRGNS